MALWFHSVRGEGVNEGGTENHGRDGLPVSICASLGRLLCHGVGASTPRKSMTGVAPAGLQCCGEGGLKGPSTIVRAREYPNENDD
jgi:hypothetical protein